MSYDGVMAFERITVDPERMGGAPCIRNLRVTVSTVLGQLAVGRGIEQSWLTIPTSNARTSTPRLNTRPQRPRNVKST